MKRKRWHSSYYDEHDTTKMSIKVPLSTICHTSEFLRYYTTHYVYSRINTLHRMTTNTMQQLLIGGSKHFNVGRPRPPRWPLFLRPCRYNCSSCVLRQVTSESVAVHSFNSTHHYQFTLHIANMATSSVHRYDLQVSNDLGTNVRSVYVRLGQSVACLPGRLWVRKK